VERGYTKEKALKNVQEEFVGELNPAAGT